MHRGNCSCVTSLRLQLFGSVQAWVGDAPIPRLRTRKGYLLLALLALRGGGALSRDWLIGTLWPESDQESGAMSLRRALHDLRAALGEAAAVLESPDKRHLRFNPALAEVDALAFTAQATRFERSQALEAAESAVALYQGPLLADFDEDTVVVERQRLHQQAQALLLTVAEASLQQGQASKALTLARRGEGLDPLHEGTQRLLYRALAASGDPAGARQAYRAFRLRLYEELRQAPSAETRQCLENLATLSPSPHAAPSTAPSTAPPVDTLPFFLSTYLGREEDRKRLVEQLEQGRLTTLLGPGGVGKTRLAVETARHCAGTCHAGLFFVDLTALPIQASVDAVWATLAHALFRETRQEEHSPREQACDFLRTRQALLLLDNAEHVYQATATVVQEILAVAPALRVLVTSRVPLGIPGEQLHPLAPLALPKSGQLSVVQESDAALFFVQRAQTSRPDFALTPENAAEVAQLCQRLDGIPLALELAAAHLRFLSLADLVRRVADPLHTLKGGEQRTDRQRTLENLIAWSYSPLAPPVQRLFRRLSLFPDTFCLEAVEWLGEEEDTLEHLATLVDSSLVQVSEDSLGFTRYRLLELIRAFGQQHLALSDDATRAPQRLAHWGVAFLTQAYAGLWGAEGGLWIRRIAGELRNLRAALDAGDGDTALPITHLLEQFWWRTNRFREGIEWFTHSLSKPGGSEEERWNNTLGREQFKHLLGEPNTVEEAIAAAIAHYQRTQNTESVFYLLHSLAVILSQQERHEEAEAQMRKSLSLVAEFPSDQAFYRGYAELGMLEVLQRARRYAEACRYGQAALARFLELGRDAHAVQVRLQFGRVLLGEGLLEKAQEMLLEGLSAARRGGMRDQELEFLLSLGDVAQARHESQEARRYYELILQSAEQGGLRAPAELARRALAALHAPLE